MNLSETPSLPSALNGAYTPAPDARIPNMVRCFSLGDGVNPVVPVSDGLSSCFKQHRARRDRSQTGDQQATKGPTP
jgi:hypothetical protein